VTGEDVNPGGKFLMKSNLGVSLRGRCCGGFEAVANLIVIDCDEARRCNDGSTRLTLGSNAVVASRHGVCR
jgi:hypothetical protein